MLAIERERTIVDLVNDQGIASVRHLATLCGVTPTTIRRDLDKLEADGRLRRTRGGAVKAMTMGANGTAPDLNDHDNGAAAPDALIVAPVQHRNVHTMRERALRNRIPLLAESAHFEGAIYLGPRNFEGSFELGRWAGEYASRHMDGQAHVLNITANLSNIRARSAGFSHGIDSVLGDGSATISVNGGCLFNEAYHAALDALRLHPEINVIFGVNDDSILGGLQAYQDLRRSTDDLLAVNVGGEGKTLFDVLRQGGSLKACLALFPEVVGRLAVDAVERLWAGEDLGNEIITPSAVVTSETLTNYYAKDENAWHLKPAAVDALEQTRWASPTPPPARKRISFVIHYRTHEWYQNLARSMKERAVEKGIELSVVDVQQGLDAEIRELQRLIGKVAASYVEEGEHVILDAGPYTDYMAQFLQNCRKLTVVTNSLTVWERLRLNPEINLTLTGGELHHESQALVGRGAELLLRELRADKAFVVAAGVSGGFGISAPTLPQAGIRRAMVGAAREVVLLADHTVIGTDSRVHVETLDKIHTIVTDPGVCVEHRMMLNQLGIKVVVAGQFSNGNHSV